MATKQETEKALTSAIKEIKKLASGFEPTVFRRALRRWDKSVTEKARLEKEQRALEQKLAQVRKRLN